MSLVYAAGSALVLELVEVIPSETEVAKTEDFSEAEPAESTG